MGHVVQHVKIEDFAPDHPFAHDQIIVFPLPLDELLDSAETTGEEPPEAPETA